MISTRCCIVSHGMLFKTTFELTRKRTPAARPLVRVLKRLPIVVHFCYHKLDTTSNQLEREWGCNCNGCECSAGNVENSRSFIDLEHPSLKQLARTMQKIENMQTRLAKEIEAKKTQQQMESEEEKKKLVDMITQLRSDLRSGREEIEHPSRAGHKRRGAENIPDDRDDQNNNRPPVSDRDDQRPTRPPPRGRGGDTAERPRKRNDVRGRAWRRSNPNRCSVVNNFAFLKTVRHKI